METLNVLETRIRKRLTDAQAHKRHSQESIGREMAEHEERSQAFATVSERLTADFIRPRMKLLASMFSNARLTSSDDMTTRQWVCHFERTPEYPANTKLGLRVSPNDAMNSAIISYSLEILPIFFQFDRHDELVVPLDDVNEESVSAWLDAKVLQFTDDYLRLPSIEQYQQENMVGDPVCGMRINRAHAAGVVEHNGRTYYFCVDECRKKFLDDPQRYLA